MHTRINRSPTAPIIEQTIQISIPILLDAKTAKRNVRIRKRVWKKFKEKWVAKGRFNSQSKWLRTDGFNCFTFSKVASERIQDE